MFRPYGPTSFYFVFHCLATPFYGCRPINEQRWRKNVQKNQKMTFRIRGPKHVIVNNAKFRPNMCVIRDRNNNFHDDDAVTSRKPPNHVCHEHFSHDRQQHICLRESAFSVVHVFLVEHEVLRITYGAASADVTVVDALDVIVFSAAR